MPTDVFHRFRSDPDGAAFILDFDGCLSRIVPHPEEASVVQGGREAVEALASRYAMVSVVSGRRAADVAGRLGAPGVRYLGLYGAEEIMGDRLVQHPDAGRWRGMASRCARDAEAMVTSGGLTGCEVEYKDLAVSIHYRNAIDPHAAENISTWASAIAPARGMVVAKGRMVIEMRPLGMSKASAVDSLAGSPWLRSLLVAGDDSSDVEAMSRSRVLHGVFSYCVGVHSAEEPQELGVIADELADGPEALVELLRRFVY